MARSRITTKSISPLFSVLGAILVFASWAMNSAIVEKHKSNISAMSNIITQKRLFDYLTNITKSQNDQLHKLQNLEGTTNIIVQQTTENPIVKKDEYFFQYLQNSGRIAADYEKVLNLQKNSQVLGDLSELVSLPAENRRDIESTVKNVSSFYRRYYDKKSELEKRVMTPPAGESWWKASEQVRRNEDVLNELEGEYYLPLINEIHRHYAFLYANAKSELRRSAKLSKLSGRISVFAYVLGSLMIIYGRWQDHKRHASAT